VLKVPREIVGRQIRTPEQYVELHDEVSDVCCRNEEELVPELECFGVLDEWGYRKAIGDAVRLRTVLPRR